jgi:hypothetical protein
MINAANTASKEVLKWVKENKEAFINKAALMYDPFFITLHGTTGWQAEVFRRFRENPKYGCKVLAVGRTLSVLWKHESYWGLTFGNYQNLIDILQIIISKRWKRIYKKLPTQDDTRVMKELIERGYVFNETEIGKGNYVICSSHYPLLWPKAFETRKEAASVHQKQGIIHYTTIQQLIN